jgi:hypothetical protein
MEQKRNLIKTIQWNEILLARIDEFDFRKNITNKVVTMPGQLS